jgi:hypothetical protein
MGKGNMFDRPKENKFTSNNKKWFIQFTYWFAFRL